MPIERIVVIVFLVFFVLSFALNASIRNHSKFAETHQESIPDALKATIDPETRAKSLDIHRSPRTRFGKCRGAEASRAEVIVILSQAFCRG